MNNTAVDGMLFFCATLRVLLNVRFPDYSEKRTAVEL